MKENEEDGMSVGGWKERPCGWLGAFTPSCSHLRTRHGRESTSLPLHSDLGRSLDWDDAQTTRQGYLEISGFMIQSVRPDHLGGVPAVFYLYTYTWVCVAWPAYGLVKVWEDHPFAPGAFTTPPPPTDPRILSTEGEAFKGVSQI